MSPRVLTPPGHTVGAGLTHWQPLQRGSRGLGTRAGGWRRLALPTPTLPCRSAPAPIRPASPPSWSPLLPELLQHQELPLCGLGWSSHGAAPQACQACAKFSSPLSVPPTRLPWLQASKSPQPHGPAPAQPVPCSFHQATVLTPRVGLLGGSGLLLAKHVTLRGVTHPSGPRPPVSYMPAVCWECGERAPC